VKEDVEKTVDGGEEEDDGAGTVGGV